MSAYQIAGPAVVLTANVTPATESFTFAEVTGNLAGAKAPLFLKVTNASASLGAYFNASTTVLSVATAGTIIGPGETDYIQVLTPESFQTVYIAASASSAVTLYVSPVTLVA